MKVGINPYLYFDGRCQEAFEHYARVLGGEIAFLMRYGEAPVGMRGDEDCDGGGPPSGWQDKIMHASLKIGDQVIMGSDAPPQHQMKTQGFSISLTVASSADAERAFAGLADGGSMFMPLTETFFAERFGMLTDRYGVAWMVNFPGAVDARNEASRAAAVKGDGKPGGSKPVASAVKPAAKAKRAPAR